MNIDNYKDAIKKINASDSFKQKTKEKALAQNLELEEKTRFERIFCRVKSFFKFNKEKTMFATACVLAFVCLCVSVFNPIYIGTNSKATNNIFGFVSDFKFVSDIEIKALGANEYGVITNDSGFVLTSKKAIEQSEVEQNLVVQPAFEYNLEKQQDGKQYVITPSNELEKNTVYTLAFDPVQKKYNMPQRMSNSWAFQTQRDFDIDEIFPRNESSCQTNTSIIVSFTEFTSLEQVQKNVTITPQIDGKWQTNDGLKFTFIPSQLLIDKTIYNININEQLADKNGKNKLPKSTSSVFKTESKATSAIEFNYENNAFASKIVPFFEIMSSYDNFKNDNQVEATVFCFESIDDYIRQFSNVNSLNKWEIQKQEKVDVSKCTKVLEAKLPIMEDKSGYSTFSLPENLKKGFYYMDVKTNNKVGQYFFQVTDVSAYISITNGKSLFWVNNTATKQPIKDAVITQVGNDKTAKTGDDGTAFFETVINEKLETTNIFIIKKGNESLVLENTYYEDNRPIVNNDYWTYLYTDKPLYQPDDTINFCGVISPKYKSVSNIEKATVSIDVGGYFKSEIKQEVTVKDGVFQGEIKLDGITTNPYTINLLIGEKDIACYSAYVNVEHYKKPTSQIDIKADKTMVFAGEDVTYTITASYFDGTPVMDLPVTTDVFDNKKTMTTDSKGVVKLTCKAPLNVNSDVFSHNYMRAYALLPETGEVTQDISTYVFNQNIDFKYQSRRINDDCKLTIQPFKVDLNFENKGDIYQSNQYQKPFKGTQKLKLDFYRRYYIKVKDGTYYDAYTRQIIQKYKYEEKKELEKTENIILNGGSEKEFITSLNSEKGYSIEVSGTDSNNNAFSFITYIDSKDNDSRPEAESSVAFMDNTLKNSIDNNKFKIGETVNVGLRNNYYWNYSGSSNSESIQMDGKKALFYRTADKIIDYKITENNDNYSFVFDEKYLPNVVVNAVIFDGRTYKVCRENSAYIDFSDYELTAQIKSDKEKYKPGENVKLTVKLQDSKGNNVSGFVNLNLVDEALLSIQEMNVDVLNSIYRNWYNYNYLVKYDTISHNLPELMDGGRGGGGDGGGRTDFRDTALFKTVKTDSNGFAQVEFKLPDNITTWRVVWNAFISEDVVKCGNGTAKVISSLPFFTDIRTEDTFLAGDNPKIGLRCAGAVLGINDIVEYKIECKSLGFEKTLSAKETDWFEVELGEITSSQRGKHDITVTATYKGYEDKITKQFAVLDSFATHQEFKGDKLNPETKLTISETRPDQIYSLIVCDKDKKQIIRGLYNCLYQSNVRVEQIIAKDIAAKYLNQYYDYNYTNSQSDIMEIGMKYQDADGGISSFLNSKSSVETTAFVAAYASEYFNKADLKTFLYSALKSAEEKMNVKDISLALMGLAGLKEPVLPKIQRMLADEKITPQIKINLATAMAVIGNGGSIRESVNNFINTNCAKTENLMFANQSPIRDVNIKMTADLSVLSTLLNLPQGELLYNYVLENPRDDEKFLLEQVMILKHRASTVSKEESSFEYDLGNGNKQQVSFVTDFSIALTKEQVENIKFSNIKGDIDYMLIYDEIGLTKGQSEYIKLKQEYVDTSDNIVSQSQLLNVKIDVTINNDAPDGMYEIKYIMPSGMKYSGMRKSEYSNAIWVSSIDGQQITAYIYKTKNGKSGTLDFYLRTSMTGIFTCEGTTVTKVNDFGIAKSLDGHKITIK